MLKIEQPIELKNKNGEVVYTDIRTLELEMGEGGSVSIEMSSKDVYNSIIMDLSTQDVKRISDFLKSALSSHARELPYHCECNTESPTPGPFHQTTCPLWSVEVGQVF